MSFSLTNRVKFREDWNGLPILLNLIDSALFGMEAPPELAVAIGVPEPDSRGAKLAVAIGVPEPDSRGAKLAVVTGVPEPDSRGASDSTAGSEPVSGGEIPTATSVQRSPDSDEATPPALTGDSDEKSESETNTVPPDTESPAELSSEGPESNSGPSLAPPPALTGDSDEKSESETNTVPPDTESPAELSSEGPESNSGPSLAPLRDSVYCLSVPLQDQQLAMLSEALKIVFNQTVHWKEDADYDDVRMM